jgi:endonuclease/exonuclease/phosphatase family metal-dependent hydrolase
MRYPVRWLLLCLFFQCLSDLTAQTNSRGELCFVWYNAENLFYPENDSLPGDDEFTPEGMRHWTWSRYREKLTALSKVIIASGKGASPELVGLCEVENARVLEDLAAHPILAPYHYCYLHREGPDHRGMEVACLIRKESFDTIQWETIAFKLPVLATREMLHITLCRGIDTMEVFLVHLLSKYGGAGATAQLRKNQAEQLVHCMDSVNTASGHSLIMAAGDFNDEYDGYSMKPLRSARIGADSLQQLHPVGGRGSYKYRGKWSYIDHVLVTRSFQQYKVTTTILQLSPLITEDLEYGGIKPKRSYEGFQYRGGISDHLPVVVNLTLSLSSDPHGR